MFGVCRNRLSPTLSSSVFLFPAAFQCCRPSSPPAWTSACTLTSSTPPDSDVTPPPEVDKLDDSVGPDVAETASGDVSSGVDVMTSPARPSSSSPLADDDVTCHRRHDDVTVTSPSKELKFGIERILVKDDDIKNRASPTGIYIDAIIIHHHLLL